MTRDEIATSLLSGILSNAAVGVMSDGRLTIGVAQDEASHNAHLRRWARLAVDTADALVDVLRSDP